MNLQRLSEIADELQEVAEQINEWDLWDTWLKKLVQKRERLCIERDLLYNKKDE